MPARSGSGVIGCSASKPPTAPASVNAGAPRRLPTPPFTANTSGVQQDHQPVHGRPAARLCLGSLDDLRHRRLRHWLDLRGSTSSPAPAFSASPAFHRSIVATTAGLPAAASNTWCTRARSWTSSSASSTSTSICGTRTAFCFNPGCGVANARTTIGSAIGDIVRARLTIKTQGWGWAGPGGGYVVAKN